MEQKEEEVKAEEEEEGEEEEEEDKGKPDNNSFTGPNESVHVATFYCYSIYMIETKG